MEYELGCCMQDELPIKEKSIAINKNLTKFLLIGLSFDSVVKLFN